MRYEYSSPVPPWAVGMGAWAIAQPVKRKSNNVVRAAIWTLEMTSRGHTQPLRNCDVLWIARDACKNTKSECRGIASGASFRWFTGRKAADDRQGRIFPQL